MAASRIVVPAGDVDLRHRRGVGRRAQPLDADDPDLHAACTALDLRLPTQPG